MPDFDQENVQAFFDIQIGRPGTQDLETERVIFELFSKQVPKTAENFRALCTGEKEGLHFKRSWLHRVLKGHMAMGGDITIGNGMGGRSIYGLTFNDEQVWFPHSHKGLLSTGNSGPNSNTS